MLKVDMGPRTYFAPPEQDNRTLRERIQRIPSTSLAPLQCEACERAPCKCKPLWNRPAMDPCGGPTPAQVSAGHVDWQYHGSYYKG